MIAIDTYLLFVAPFVMGLGGLAIYVVAERFTRPEQHTPAE